jgi:sugar lactone lactonase YvrE
MANNVNPDGSLATIDGSHGRLFRVNAAREVSVWRDTIGISNTLCWSPNHRRLYFADSLANTIYSYEFDPETGDIAEEKPFFSGFVRGCPDGSTVDSEGFLWNCRFGGGCIVRVAPDGDVERVIEMPTLNPTTCTFGGENLQKLFVTSASILAEPKDRLAGSLFEVDVEVSGLAEYRYKLQ